MADLGGVPRVLEPTLVELDTGQAGRLSAQTVRVHATYVVYACACHV